jgi:excinuclease ABC subunit C
MPRWNRTAGGQEVPVWIRLDRGPATPGLSVVHEHLVTGAEQDFGPYLGGLRVRTAVAGLDRVLPLSYTGTRVRGAAREMARVRGVDLGDRDVIVDRVTAVLARDPIAVSEARAALESARDRAAAALAFELAGRIQAERDALDWITGPQRVTGAAPAEADIFGWSDGLLVRFGIRDGRLREWALRACAREEAGSGLAGTPHAWRAFAQRNAELAAALAGNAPA